MEATAHAEVRSGALRLRASQLGSTCTIALFGELDLANAEAFQTMLRESRTGGATAVVVDLEALEFIDSSGIACLIHAHRELKEAGSCLRIAGAHAPGVRRVIEVTGLDEELVFIADGIPPA